MLRMSPPKSWIPIGRSYSKMSSFCRLFAASRMRPSEEINSVYIKSAPPSLQTARNGGSLTSSIGASNKGKSPNSICPIFTIFGAKIIRILSMSVPNLVSDRSPLLSLLLILLNVFLGFVLVGPMLGLGVASLFYDGNLLNDIQNPNDNPGIVLALLTTQSIATLVGLIIFPAIHIVSIEHKPISRFFPPQRKTLFVLFLVMAVGLTFMIAISPLVEWNMNLKFPEFLKEFETWARNAEDKTAQLTKIMTDFGSVGDLMIGLIVIALLPAIGEELVFRGMFQNEFFRGTGNIHLAIWASALIFSAIHFQFYGFIPRVLLGALFGYLYYWSGTLLVPMFAHFFNNAFGVMMIYLYRQKITELNVEDNTAAPLQYVILNAVLTVGLLYYIWKHYRQTPILTSDRS